MKFSIIVPVYNRPEEIKIFLDSVLHQNSSIDFEVIVVEDGSSITCKEVVKTFTNKLNIKYYFKINSGPGDSRNFGMRMATGDYFLIFDSDCILPSQYLDIVSSELASNFVDCFGGPDAAMDSFSDIQKAINYAMTSFLTTGGIRGGSETIDKFQPRSFNMGLSRAAFIASNGFSNIHPGEDPDLSMRLWNLGYNTKLFNKAFVYHKRRINWSKYFTQVHKFGLVRPILDIKHPNYKKRIFIFPTLFTVGFLLANILVLFKIYFLAILYFIYVSMIFLRAGLLTKNLRIASLAVLAVFIQFFGYGSGFAHSYIAINIFRKNPTIYFPQLFFKINEN